MFHYKYWLVRVWIFLKKRDSLKQAQVRDSDNLTAVDK